MTAPYGHADLDALLAELGRDSADVTVRIGAWPPLLIRLATYWFQHSLDAHPRLTGGRIVLSNPTPLPWQRPAHQSRSGVIRTPVEFAVIGVETVKALAELLAADPLRNAFFAAADVPDVPLRISLGVDAIPADTQHAEGTEGAVALMQITMPQHVPARFWPEDMESGAQELVTSIDYPQMIEAVGATWAAWLG
jgi:hypothetical protein